jgi:hypothetical protein
MEHHAKLILVGGNESGGTSLLGRGEGGGIVAAMAEATLVLDEDEDEEKECLLKVRRVVFEMNHFMRCAQMV